MTNKTLMAASIAVLLLMACQINSKNENTENNNSSNTKTKTEDAVTDIAFTVAKNYFVNNTVKNLDNPKIETADKFNEIFGMATTMGNDGKPTQIDFQKKYVIAVILPETDLMTTVEPIRLQKDAKGNITLLYKKTLGQKQTYTTRPGFQIIVDKSENGSIALKEQK